MYSSPLHQSAPDGQDHHGGIRFNHCPNSDLFPDEHNLCNELARGQIHHSTFFNNV
jgi:hypothetical protein